MTSWGIEKLHNVVQKSHDKNGKISGNGNWNRKENWKSQKVETMKTRRKNENRKG